MAEVILFGEPMAMFVADAIGPLEEIEHFTKSLAGSEVNVAIGLHRLGHTVSYVSRLGNDPFGRYINNRFASEGIETQFTYDAEHSTGFQLKSRVTSGDPEVCYFRKNSAATYLTEQDINAVDFSGVRHLHLTGILPAISQNCRDATYRLIEHARENSIPVSFDPNLRPGLWENEKVMIRVLNDLASRCDIVLPGLNEGKILMGSDDPEEIAAYYLDKGAKMVTVKLGCQGSFTRTADESFFLPCADICEIVDTVGAGDGFAVGIISGMLEGLSLYETVKRGNVIGALQLMVAGDNEGLPTKKELDDFIKEADHNETTACN